VKQICIWCGKEITSYSDNPTIAAYERKRSLHWECFRGDIEGLMDNLTSQHGYVPPEFQVKSEGS
jgi:hypothetical protein